MDTLRPDESGFGARSWFEGLRADPSIINLGLIVGAQFGVRAVEGLTVVVDTNVVLSELRWLAKNPGRPVVHASVPGLAQSGILRPICPRLLEDEVERHLPRMAAAIGQRVEALEAAWRGYRIHLRFVDVVPASTAAVRYVEQRDPHDVDFVHVQEGFGIDVILTNDRDLKDSPAPTAEDPTALLKALRVYEKEKRYTFALVVGGWQFAMAGQISIPAIARMVRIVWRAFLSLPWWIQLGTGIAAAYGISRLKKEHVAWVRRVVGGFIREAIELAEQRHAVEGRATLALESARRKVPLPRGRRTLLPCVRRALLEASNGATDAELAKAIVILGYKTTSKDLPSYLGRVLRRRGSEVVRRDGRWHLGGPRVSA